jgi:hypothetical protein
MDWPVFPLLTKKNGKVKCKLCYNMDYSETLTNSMELPCSQKASTGLYPEPDETSPYHPILTL